MNQIFAKTIPALAALMFCAVSCGGSKGGTTPTGKDDNSSATSVWKMKNYPIEKVEVYSDDTLLETFEFTYDKGGRVATLVRTDKTEDRVLLNLRYSYSGETGMDITGRYLYTSADRTLKASLDADRKTLSYKGEWNNAWDYSVSIGSDGVPVRTETSPDFSPSEGYYSSRTDYSEQYSVSGGNIRKVDIGTQIDAKSQRTTSTSSSSSLTIEYEYSKEPDNQNFAVFLMNCELPVWYAAELPGCKNLITGMKMSSGGVKSEVSFKVDYVLNEDGDIESATRTDFNGSDVVLTRVYKFFYL